MAGWNYGPSSSGGSTTTSINSSHTVSATETDGAYTLLTTMILQPCRVVSFYQLPILDGLINIDSIQLVSGDRVLVVNQNDPKTNGIYIAKIGLWERSPDFDSSEKIKSRALIPIAEGDINHGTSWSLVSPDPIILGTSNLIFEKVMYGSHNGVEIPFNETNWDTYETNGYYELLITHNLNTLRADVTIFETNNDGDDEIVDISDIDFVSLNAIRLRIPYSSNSDLRFSGYIFIEPNR